MTIETTAMRNKASDDTLLLLFCFLVFECNVCVCRIAVKIVDQGVQEESTKHIA